MRKIEIDINRFRFTLSVIDKYIWADILLGSECSGWDDNLNSTFWANDLKQKAHNDNDEVSEIKSIFFFSSIIYV